MPNSLRRLAPALLIGISLVAGGVCGEGAEGGGEKLSFESDILPIFRSKCIRCHAGVEPKAGLNLTSPSSLLSGGESGPALRIGAAEFSLLYDRVSSGAMPPEGQPLTAAEKGLIRTWINEGAAGVGNLETLEGGGESAPVEHWAFRPPRRPAPPELSAAGRRRARNPIDAFVISRLQEQGLELAPEADRDTLLRRAAMQLTGLPPTVEQRREFREDIRPGAHQRMVERLLASPEYGERWGRHWLDVAGYAESAGILSEDRELPLAWRYRDYVIRAFNQDKPYDRFLQEQIAGDELTGYWQAFERSEELPAEVVEGVTATGFLRMAADSSRPDFKSIKNAESLYYYPTLFDTLQIVCSSTMGLTVQCARCHSHKFDPIPQADYYRLQAVFMTSYRIDRWVPQMERRLQLASKRQQQQAQQRNAEIDAAVKGLQGQADALKAKFRDRLLDDRLEELPEEIRDDVRAAVSAQPDSRDEVQKYLAAKFEAKLLPKDGQLDEALATYPEYRQLAATVQERLQEQQRQRVVFDEVRALYDLPGETRTPLLLRGDPLTPGPPVEPGVLSALDTPEPFDWTPPAEGAVTSGRRLALARWLTQKGHPLTARVMANRVWMHHFGRGLVSTPQDFGVSGDPPSHPLLLDYLATEFQRGGWSVKQLHRLILNSATWRQASRVGEDQRLAAERVDPGNRLLWRQSLRRLEAEALRDSLLAVSGTLDKRQHGPSHGVTRQQDGEVIVADPAGRHRRSVYIKVKRLNPLTMLEVFDQPTMTVNCVRRSTSTVSTQALTLLNSSAMASAAEGLAARALAESPDDPAGQVVRLALAREPAADELRLLTEFLEGQTRRHLDTEQPPAADEARRRAVADLAQMVLSSNEFAYTD